MREIAVAGVAELFETTPRNWRSRLAVAVDLMREISRHTDPDELYRVYVRRMAQIYPTDRQVSLTRRGLDRPRLRVTRFNLWPESASPYTAERGRQPVLTGGVLADLLYAGEARVIDSLHVPADDPAAEYLAGQQSLLAIPLFEGGAAVNMVVLTREGPHAFPREQVPELVWMCNLFSRALQTQVRSERLQAAYNEADFDLQAVGELQHSLIPAELPRPAGLELAAHYRTANRAGGDYYDFFPLPDGKFGVLLADVSGHGTHAAVLLAITHSLAHAFPEPPASPGHLLAYLNAHLARHYTRTSGSFVTALYVVFDPAANAVTYSTAGHPPPRLCRAGEPTWTSDPAPHRLPLGVAPRDADYPEQVTRFAPGDRLALFTDGVTEAVNLGGELFGYDRLDAALAWAPAVAREVVGEVVSALGRFAGPAPLADDQTMLVVRRTAVPGPESVVPSPAGLPSHPRFPTKD